MCQLNLVFIKNSNNKKILESNGYTCFNYNLNNFSPYVKGFCNCGSFVGSMSEYTGNSYREMIDELNDTELEKLNKIKDFMNEPDYKKQREKYIADRDRLSNTLEKILEPIFKYEYEQMNLLKRKYKDKDLETQRELLYMDLDKKSQETQNSSEYKSAEANLNDFVEKNQLMEESTLYYLTKEDENKECGALPADVFLSQLTESNNTDNNIEYSNIPEENSLVIDTVINRLKNKYNADYNIFLEYKQLFENLLENEEYIFFSCIWNEPEKMSIEKEVNIKNIKIEDLASLEYNQILKIYK